MYCSFDLVEIIKTYISIKNERESEYKAYIKFEFNVL